MLRMMELIVTGSEFKFVWFCRSMGGVPCFLMIQVYIDKPPDTAAQRGMGN